MTSFEILANEAISALWLSHSKSRYGEQNPG